jgi:hypothetical protein
MPASTVAHEEETGSDQHDKKADFKPCHCGSAFQYATFKINSNQCALNLNLFSEVSSASVCMLSSQSNQHTIQTDLAYYFVQRVDLYTLSVAF